jgi:hypothetical protein
VPRLNLPRSFSTARSREGRDRMMSGAMHPINRSRPGRGYHGNRGCRIAPARPLPAGRSTPQVAGATRVRHRHCRLLPRGVGLVRAARLLEPEPNSKNPGRGGLLEFPGSLAISSVRVRTEDRMMYSYDRRIRNWS